MAMTEEERLERKRSTGRRVRAKRKQDPVRHAKQLAAQRKYEREHKTERYETNARRARRRYERLTSTPEGRAKLAEKRRRHGERDKERMKTDPVFAAGVREKNRDRQKSQYKKKVGLLVQYWQLLAAGLLPSFLEIQPASKCKAARLRAVKAYLKEQQQRQHETYMIAQKLKGAT